EEASARGLILRAACAVVMMPVHQRIIQTDAQAFAASSIHIFADEIAARSLLWRAIIRGFGIEVAETFMVLRGHDHIAHAGFLCELCPIPRRKRLRLELLCQRSVFRNRYAFVLHNPLVAAEHAVKPPMNEHAEARFVPPLHPANAIRLVAAWCCFSFSLH